MSGRKTAPEAPGAAIGKSVAELEAEADEQADVTGVPTARQMLRALLRNQLLIGIALQQAASNNADAVRACGLEIIKRVERLVTEPATLNYGPLDTICPRCGAYIMNPFDAPASEPPNG
jgi:hypothetical protein